MTTWTRQQVCQIQDLRSAVSVTDEALKEYRDEALASARRGLYRNLQEAGRTYGVELHTADCVITQTCTDYERSWGHQRFTARWVPQARPTELHGGPRDGQLVCLADQRPLRVALSPGPAAWLLEGGNSEPAVSQVVVYSLSGWHEEARHWVYTTT